VLTRRMWACHCIIIMNYHGLIPLLNVAVGVDLLIITVENIQFKSRGLVLSEWRSNTLLDLVLLL
jgi:hypothetical protein